MRKIWPQRLSSDEQETRSEAAEDQDHAETNSPMREPVTFSLSAYKNRISLSNWYFDLCPNNFKMTGVPLSQSSQWIVIYGSRPDMADAWHSSIVTERFTSTHISTGSGNSLYILVGPIAEQNMGARNFSNSFIAKFSRGFPEDWRETLIPEIKRINEATGTELGISVAIDGDHIRKKGTPSRKKISEPVEAISNVPAPVVNATIKRGPGRPRKNPIVVGPAKPADIILKRVDLPEQPKLTDTKPPTESTPQNRQSPKPPGKRGPGRPRKTERRETETPKNEEKISKSEAKASEVGIELQAQSPTISTPPSQTRRSTTHHSSPHTSSSPAAKIKSPLRSRLLSKGLQRTKSPPERHSPRFSKEGTSSSEDVRTSSSPEKRSRERSPKQASSPMGKKSPSSSIDKTEKAQAVDPTVHQGESTNVVKRGRGRPKMTSQQKQEARLRRQQQKEETIERSKSPPSLGKRMRMIHSPSSPFPPSPSIVKKREKRVRTDTATTTIQYSSNTSASRHSGTSPVAFKRLWGGKIGFK